jgi:hypothetical protein
VKPLCSDHRTSTIFVEKPIQTQTKMDITQKRHSQTSQSLFRMNVKNTRILINGNENIKQSLIGPRNLKTTPPAGRKSVGCCSIQRQARTTRRQSTKTVNQQNTNEMILRYNLT